MKDKLTAREIIKHHFQSIWSHSQYESWIDTLEVAMNEYVHQQTKELSQIFFNQLNKDNEG